MKRVHAVSVASCLTLAFMLAPSADAMQLLTREKALEQVLGTADVDEVSVTLSSDHIDSIVKQLREEAGRQLPANHRVVVQPSVAYLYPVGERHGNVAVILEEPGLWGPVEFAIALDTGSGEVKEVAVMSYTERRGRPIARANFLRQFNGNKLDDPIVVGRGIRAISGATVSSWAAAIAVRKVQLHYHAGVLQARDDE